MTLDPLAPLPFLTQQLPGIGGHIKEQPQDFEVEEVPAYEPSGDWTVPLSVDRKVRHRRRVFRADFGAPVGSAGWGNRDGRVEGSAGADQANGVGAGERRSPSQQNRRRRHASPAHQSPHEQAPRGSSARQPLQCADSITGCRCRSQNPTPGQRAEPARVSQFLRSTALRQKWRNG